MKKDFLSIGDLKLDELRQLLDLGSRVKTDSKAFSGSLSGKTLALLFQKPSLRTRVSFEVGMRQLGGGCIYLGPDEVNLGVRESVRDIAKTLSRYVDCIVLRTFQHNNTVEFARHASVPVINGLSDQHHPCQALSDIFTVKEKLGRMDGIKLAFIGDGNNVCSSLLQVCSMAGIDMSVATPPGREPKSKLLAEAKKLAEESGSVITISHNPEQAVMDASVVYTDVWASMGQERGAGDLKALFSGFQVNARLLSLAKKGALVMHCLPAHRGMEITDDVIDGPNSVVFDQAENRLHMQNALLLWLMGNIKNP